MAAEASEHFYGFRPLPSRGRVVSNAVIDGLREDEPAVRRGGHFVTFDRSVVASAVVGMHDEALTVLR